MYSLWSVGSFLHGETFRSRSVPFFSVLFNSFPPYSTYVHSKKWLEDNIIAGITEIQTTLIINSWHLHYTSNIQNATFLHTCMCVCVFVLCGQVYYSIYIIMVEQLRISTYPFCMSAGFVLFCSLQHLDSLLCRSYSIYFCHENPNKAYQMGWSLPCDWISMRGNFHLVREQRFRNPSTYMHYTYIPVLSRSVRITVFWRK